MALSSEIVSGRINSVESLVGIGKAQRLRTEEIHGGTLIPALSSDEMQVEETAELGY